MHAQAEIRTTTLRAEHERELGDYFTAIAPMFERSTAGGMFEKLALFKRTLAAQYAQKHGYSIYPHGPITARPTLGRSSEEPSYVPSDEALILAARVSRRLMHVARHDSMAYLALELYYGMIGRGYASERVGSIFAVFPCTPRGMALIAQAQKQSRARGADITQTAHKWLENVLGNTSGARDERRAREDDYAVCLAEAHRALSKARAAYIAASRAHPKRMVREADR